MAKSVIITCAVTGSIHTPTMSEHLPITPNEIATDAIAAAEADKRDTYPELVHSAKCQLVVLACEFLLVRGPTGSSMTSIVFTFPWKES